jgi:tetratricopeptide (TPR) repeat protein
MAPVLALLGQPVDERWWMELSPDQQRRRTLNAVTHVLTRAAATRPVCVIVEDLHWADPETLAVLDSIVDGLASARITLVVTYRPEHQHEWASTSGYRQIRVDTFSATAAAPMLRALLGETPELAPVAAIVAERTDGNPFFLEETVRHLAETGALVGEPGAYRLGRLPAIAQVPDTVHAVIASRIDRVPPEDKRVLQEAAAIGKEFSRGLLEAIGDLAHDDLGPTLARLQAREFIYELRIFPEAEYAFRHALTHDVAYGGLVRDRRHALDARIVAALEAEPRGGVGHVDRLAHHALRGELWDRAVVHCRKAGALALSRFANRGAASHFEQALTALGHLTPAPETTEVGIDIRLELRSALLPLGQYRRILELLTEAKVLAEGLGDRRRGGGIESFLCNYFTLRFAFAQAVQHGTAALDIARAVGDRTLAVVTNSVLAAAYYGWGEYRRSVAVGTEAMDEADGISAQRFGMVLPPPVYARTLVAWSLAELGDFAGGEHVAREAMSRANALAHPHSVIFASLGLGVVHLRRGAAAEAVDVLERALAAWETADLPAVLLEVAGPLASAYVAAGRAGDAMTLLERAVAQALVLRHRMGNVLRSGGMAEAYLALGRLEEALPLAQLYVELARMVDGRGHVAAALRLLADVTSKHDPGNATAESSIDESLALARELGMRPLEARALLTRSEILGRLGRAEEAERTLDEASGRLAELHMLR